MHARRLRGRWFEPLASLRCGLRARHIYPSLVLVQPRENCLNITERLLMGRKESNQTNKTFYFMFIKKNNSTTHGREILSNQYSISRLFFIELSLCVSPPKLGEVSRRSKQIPKSKGTNQVVPFGPLSVWGMVHVTDLRVFQV